VTAGHHVGALSARNIQCITRKRHEIEIISLKAHFVLQFSQDSHNAGTQLQEGVDTMKPIDVFGFSGSRDLIRTESRSSASSHEESQRTVTPRARQMCHRIIP
jgi:hypothetical protein